MVRVSNVTVRKRLVFVLFIGIIVFVVIAVRLGYVQFSMGNWLAKQAENSWGRDVPFEAKRGEILDRNDVVLATNVSAPSVLVAPRQVQDPVRTAEEIASVLEMDRTDAYELITKNQSLVRLPEGRKISKEKASEVRALRLPGVYIAEDSKRHYPFGSYLSHVLGFAGIDNQGLTGLELYYDEQLKGEKGYVSFFYDGKRQPHA